MLYTHNGWGGGDDEGSPVYAREEPAWNAAARPRFALLPPVARAASAAPPAQALAPAPPAPASAPAPSAQASARAELQKIGADLNWWLVLLLVVVVLAQALRPRTYILVPMGPGVMAPGPVMAPVPA